jgi:hypothetical protein
MPTDPSPAFDKALGTSDRRRDPRKEIRARVRMRVDTSELGGDAANVSSGGILFFSHGDLRVTLTIEENGSRVLRSGRLVRAQRIRGAQIGWAVEFDDA